MERQIEQLLKEVKGNETLERLVKMNKNPNELFIERIRTMNKGDNENGNENESTLTKEEQTVRLQKFIENLKRYIPIETPIETPDNQPNDPLNDPFSNQYNDLFNDLLNNQRNDPLGNQRNFRFTNSDIVDPKLKETRDELYQN